MWFIMKSFQRLTFRNGGSTYFCMDLSRTHLDVMSALFVVYFFPSFFFVSSCCIIYLWELRCDILKKHLDVNQINCFCIAWIKSNAGVSPRPLYRLIRPLMESPEVAVMHRPALYPDELSAMMLQLTSGWTIHCVSQLEMDEWRPRWA